MVILTEDHTLDPPDDLSGLVSMAVQAERAGVGAVMLSEHVCLGPDSGALGRPDNPRAYAAPGNQDPATSWPSSIVMASAIARATSTVRIALAALITPLRNPVVLVGWPGTRAVFNGADDVADLDLAMDAIADQVAGGYTTFCMKPSQHTDDPSEVFDLCRRMVTHLDSLAPATTSQPDG